MGQNLLKNKKHLFVPGIISFSLMLLFNFSSLSSVIFLGNLVPIATDCLAFLWMLAFYNKRKSISVKRTPVFTFIQIFLVVLSVVFLTRVFQLVAILSASSSFYGFVFSFRIISASILVYLLSIILFNQFLKSKRKKNHFCLVQKMILTS